jgi:type II secretory pathway predicted ATPase ExeA
MILPHSSDASPLPFPPPPPLPLLESDPFSALVPPPNTPPPAAGLPPVLPFAPAWDFIRLYGLRENPFADCVHPNFFFRTDGHSDAFRSMMLAVEFKTAFGMITGTSGTGKTMLSQMLLPHLEGERHQVVLLLVTPGLSKTGLLREILAELDIALPAGINRVQDLVKLLSNHLIALHENGRRLVIVIDEAHLLSADCLHVVRTISNIEAPDQKLTTCLLFGESRLAQRLEHPSYDSLRNRIYLRAELQPLTLDETTQYVNYRLMMAGRMADLFNSRAMQALHQHSKGIARSVNKLAMLSMIKGAMAQKELIDDTTVLRAVDRL